MNAMSCFDFELFKDPNLIYLEIIRLKCLQRNGHNKHIQRYSSVSSLSMVTTPFVIN